MSSSLLEVENLSVSYLEPQPVCVVDRVTFCIDYGETMALVGESGSGKTTLAKAMLRLFDHSGKALVSGNIRLEDSDLAGLSEAELNKIRGKKIGIIFQEPLLALNPVFRVGAQIAETIRLHTKLHRKAARERALNLLTQVGLNPARRIYRFFPHQLSGGMRQRVMIAIAFACRPQLIIADEPTSALDAPLRSDLMSFLVGHCQRRRAALLLITHDLGLALQFSQKIMIMYRGKIVEQGSTASITMRPQHPYTQRLLALNAKSILDSIDDSYRFLNLAEHCSANLVSQSAW